MVYVRASPIDGDTVIDLLQRQVPGTEWKTGQRSDECKEWDAYDSKQAVVAYAVLSKDGEGERLQISDSIFNNLVKQRDSDL